MDDWIMVLGGGPFTREAIKTAKEAGLKVLLTDLKEDCACADLADEFYQVSASDVENQVKIAGKKSRDARLVGAYCPNDFGLATVASIHRSLGLDWCDVSSINLSLDKWESKVVLEKAGVPVPSGVAVSTLQEAMKAFEGFEKRPVILKPLGKSGSIGVASIGDSDSLGKHWEFVTSELNETMVIIEETLRGRMIDVNGLFVEDQFHPCGIMERFFGPTEHAPHVEESQCLAVGETDPAELSEALKESCYQILENAARALKLTHGPVKADLVLTDEGPKMLEVTPRFHGELQTALTTPYSTGMVPIRAYFETLRGNVFDSYLRPKLGRIAGWRAYVPPLGFIRSVEGVEVARDIEGVHWVGLAKRPGEFSKGRDNSDVVARVAASAEDKISLDQLWREVDRTIKIEVEESGALP